MLLLEADRPPVPPPDRAESVNVSVVAVSGIGILCFVVIASAAVLLVRIPVRAHVDANTDAANCLLPSLASGP